MTAIGPAALFGLKMMLCLTLFLLGAAWLRRFAERIKRVRGLPPNHASALQAISHYVGKDDVPQQVRQDNVEDRQVDHERRLYRQTIRLLARELERLDPANEEAREAIDLLARSSATPSPAIAPPAFHPPGRSERRRPLPERLLAAGLLEPFDPDDRHGLWSSQEEGGPANGLATHHARGGSSRARLRVHSSGARGVSSLHTGDRRADEDPGGRSLCVRSCPREPDRGNVGGLSMGLRHPAVPDEP